MVIKPNVRLHRLTGVRNVAKIKHSKRCTVFIYLKAKTLPMIALLKLMVLFTKNQRVYGELFQPNCCDFLYPNSTFTPRTSPNVPRDFHNYWGACRNFGEPECLSILIIWRCFMWCGLFYLGVIVFTCVQCCFHCLLILFFYCVVHTYCFMAERWVTYMVKVLGKYRYNYHCYFCYSYIVVRSQNLSG